MLLSTPCDIKIIQLLLNPEEHILTISAYIRLTYIPQLNCYPQTDKLPLVKAGYYEDCGLLELGHKSIHFHFLSAVHSLSLGNAIQITKSN